MDAFDERRRRPCIYGEWTRRYYYDHRTKMCSLFWYDQSCGMHQPFKSRNVFVHLQTCMRACEGINPASKLLIDSRTTTQTQAPITTTVQPFHPHLHKQQHQKHKHIHELLPDHHPSLEIKPVQVHPTLELDPVAYPESTLATLPPIVRPAPKSTAITEQKTVGVIQAMFTISKTSRRPQSENDLLEEVTGRPLDNEDFHDLTHLIDDSPNWNKIGDNSIQQEVSRFEWKYEI